MRLLGHFADLPTDGLYLSSTLFTPSIGLVGFADT
jgi:hypothetical protein